MIQHFYVAASSSITQLFCKRLIITKQPGCGEAFGLCKPYGFTLSSQGLAGTVTGESCQGWHLPISTVISKTYGREIKQTKAPEINAYAPRKAFSSLIPAEGKTTAAKGVRCGHTTGAQTRYAYTCTYSW